MEYSNNILQITTTNWNLYFDRIICFVLAVAKGKVILLLKTTFSIVSRQADAPVGVN